MTDKATFIQEFKEESKEYLQGLNQGLLALENNPYNEECLKKMFRQVHNIKGVARMLEFKNIEDLSHSVENVLNSLKGKKIELNKNISNTLFEAFDMLNNLITSITVNGKTEGDINPLKDKLEKVVLGVSFVSEIKAVSKNETEEEKKNTNNMKAQESFRVNTAKIDNLILAVGEVVPEKVMAQKFSLNLKTLSESSKRLNKNLILFKQKLSSQSINELNDIEAIQKNLNLICKNSLELKEKTYIYYKEYNQHVDQLILSISKLQEKAMGLRMAPLAFIFNLFPRMVRDLAEQYNKKAQLEILGADTELDKKMLETLQEPLIHLLRNSIAHGIETVEEREKSNKPPVGKIQLSAMTEGDHVIIKIEDDGKGVDPEKIKKIAVEKKIISSEKASKMNDREAVNLIFKTGFSSTTETNMLSGRGIGLDIVKENVHLLKGDVILDSIPGKGTAFTLRLPLTLALIRILLVESEKKIFAFPTTSIEEVIKIDNDEIRYSDRNPTITLNRRIIPLVKLSDVLKLPLPDNSKKNSYEKLLIIVGHSCQRIGFIVDKIYDEQEVVIKGLGNYLKKIKNIAGGAILEKGEIILILDIPTLISSSEITRKSQENSQTETIKEQKAKNILVVEDSFTTREMIKNILEISDYHVITAKDGLEAIEKISSTDADLVITDIEMPGMNGFQLIKELKNNQRYKKIPIVIVSALSSDKDKKIGIEAGADAYILKNSFNQNVFFEVIERLIK